MSDASLTNLQMVKPKGPKIFLGVLGLAVAGAAAWWFTRPAGPVGEPDDPGKILVVGPDAAETATTLREFGFTTEHGDYDALAAEGAKEAQGRDGIEAILHLADLKGFGYVALEDPTTHGMESITVTGDSADVKANHTWAVFSVGDMGMPPKVTVDIEETIMPLPDYVQVLRAAFKQDRLGNTLFAESQLPMDAVDLHAKIKVAVELHGAYALLDRRIDKEHRARTEKIEEGEQAETKPTVLARPMETTESIALGDGTVLSLTQGYRLDSPRDENVTLQPAGEIELWYYPAGSTDVAERKRCDTIRGGLLPLGGTDHVLSPSGDALLLESTGSLELWSLDAKAGTCAFSRKGKIPRAEAFEHTWGEPHASGKLLRPSTPPDGMAINVWTAGEERPQAIAMPGCSLLGDPVWLDEGHFAVSCQWEPPEPDLSPDLVDPFADPDQEQAEAPEPPPPPPPAQTWIYVVQLSDSRILALPGTALGEYTGVYELMTSPRAKGLDLVAKHPWGDKLVRLRIEDDLPALFSGAEDTFTKLAEADAEALAAAALEAAADPAVDPAADPADPAAAPAAAPADPATPEPAPDAAPPAVPVAEPEADGEPAVLLRPAFVPAGATVAALSADLMKVSTIELSASADSMMRSPDGSRLVYITDGRHAVRVRWLDGDKDVTVSNNPKARHRNPRFTADGQAVIFTSDYNGADRTEEVGQYVALSGPPASAAAAKEE